MEAVAGDRIVVAAATLDGPVRDGEVIDWARREDRPTPRGGPTTGGRRFSFPVRMRI